MTELPAKYLNRLSDLLFVMARDNNNNEVLWIPGGSK
jgi:cob(I)alamin adenosyltransferase